MLVPVLIGVRLHPFVGLSLVTKLLEALLLQKMPLQILGIIYRHYTKPFSQYFIRSESHY